MKKGRRANKRMQAYIRPIPPGPRSPAAPRFSLRRGPHADRNRQRYGVGFAGFGWAVGGPGLGFGGVDLPRLNATTTLPTTWKPPMSSSP